VGSNPAVPIGLKLRLWKVPKRYQFSVEPFLLSIRAFGECL
jgi:hypothetical protein